MELLVFVSVAIAIISVFICGFVIRRVKAQINGMLDALEDIRQETATGAFYLQPMSLLHP